MKGRGPRPNLRRTSTPRPGADPGRPRRRACAGGSARCRSGGGRRSLSRCAACVWRRRRGPTTRSADPPRTPPGGTPIASPPPASPPPPPPTTPSTSATTPTVAAQPEPAAARARLRPRTTAAPTAAAHARHPGARRASSTSPSVSPGRPARPPRSATSRVQEIGRLEDVGRPLGRRTGLPTGELGSSSASRAAGSPSSPSVGHRPHGSRRGAAALVASGPARAVVRRPGEVLVSPRRMLDHQLVDVEGVQVIRAADLCTWPRCSAPHPPGPARTSRPATLFRRLGPRRWRPRPTPDRVIDWAAIQPFSEPSGEPDSARRPPQPVVLKTTNEGCHRLLPR